MIRDHAAAVNAAPPHPPEPVRTFPAPVPANHRWRCPLCGALRQHPWHLAIHLAAADRDRPDHGMSEADAWLTVATVAPLVVTGGRARRPAAAVSVAG